MEAEGEIVEGLLEKILPPRLEDAGLEDCALPPDSIKEAFLKAATAVGSRAASVFAKSGDASHEEEGRCTSDPWPNVGESYDALVGIREGVDPPPGPCVAEKGSGMPEVMGDEVASGVTGAEEMADKVVAGPDVPDGEGDACVEGLQGLKIGEKEEDKMVKKAKNDEEEDEEEKERERPILAEAYV